MKLDKTIAFMGAGNMAEALIRGLLNTGTVSADRLWATDVRAERLQYLASTYSIQTTTSNEQAAQRADIVVLAVKPQQMSIVLDGLRKALTADKLIVSIAAGIGTARIERELGGAPRVMRVMPNTPALVGAGAAGLCRGAHAREEDIATTEAILSAVGITVRVEELLMDAVTALSGSGPAYVFHVAEAMIEAGRQNGLSVEVATRLTIQTIVGAGKLLAESGESPSELRKKVTSPGGTTEAALKVMTSHRLMETFAEAIRAATERGRQLSGAA